MTQGICEICKQGSAKYKCPVCLIKFCCVSCYKSHKASDQCVQPEPAPVQTSSTESQPQAYDYETEDTVRPEKLNLLGLDKNVREDLDNPHLRVLLEHLNSSPDASKALENAMKEPIFAEFAQHCLNIVDS